jgi:hypothetical protein
MARPGKSDSAHGEPLVSRRADAGVLLVFGRVF